MLFYSVDQGSRATSVKATTFQGGELRRNVEEIDGTFTGRMSADGSTITGEWKQGDKPLPLILVRVTTETAWTIPESPKPVPLMAKDVAPTWNGRHP